MRLQSERIERGLAISEAEIDFSAGNVGDAVFRYHVGFQKVEIFGLGFKTETNSGGPVAPAQEAILNLRKTEAVTGTVTDYNEVTQLVPYPASGIIAPEAVFETINANEEFDSIGIPSPDYDPNKVPDYPIALRGDIVEIVINQLATAVTQTGRPFMLMRARTDGTPQEGPT